MNKEIVDKITEGLKKVFDENQERPNQFVVAYYRTKDDSLIGYHASTFCQVTNNILKAKRYSGEDPYPQLAVIAKNIKYTLQKEVHTGMFAEVNESIKKDDFGGLSSDEVWIDAIYLAEGMPKQSFRYQIVSD